MSGIAHGAPDNRTLLELAEDARPLLHPAVDHARWIQALADAGRRVDALAQLQIAAQLPGGRPEAHESIAFVAFGLGAHDTAREMYARVTQLMPKDATAWYNLAASERTLGRLTQAEAACDRCLALDPGMLQAALLRSHVRTQSADAHHIDQLRRWLSACRDQKASILLHYALGKELDDIGDYDQAFRHFAAGADARRHSLDYDVRQDVWKLQRIRETFDAARMSHAGALQPAQYGFILGLPRSGTTMIERVLTGNPAVASNGETDNLLKAIMDGSPAEAPDVFARFAAADPARVQEAYRKRAADPRGRRLVLEKLPFNYLYAGAIRLTLTNARVILVTRSPADNCFAMFSTLFGSAYPFSYDLSDLAAYFIAYRELTSHWRKVVPDQLLEVSYEAFIDRPAEEGARVAAHLAAEWSDSMVNIENNPAASATASAAQIRRPIYKTAAGRWRHYAKHLAPLVQALEAAGIDAGA